MANDAPVEIDLSEPENASILAELEGFDPNAPEEVEAKAEETEAEPESRSTEEVEAATEEEEGTEEVEAAAEETEAAAEPEDSELAKRLDQIQRQEKRAKEEVAAARHEYEKERDTFLSEWEPKIAEYEQYTAAKERAKYDPAGYLRAAGVEMTVEVAKQIYQVAKGGPAASAALQARKTEDDLSLMRREVQELRAELHREREEIRSQRDADEFMGRVVSSISDESPIVKNLYKNNPKKTKALLATMAHDIAAKTDEIPDALDVVKELEKSRRQEFEDAGFDLSKLPRQTPAKTIQNPAAAETRSGQTLTNDLGTPTAPGPAGPKSYDELVDETLKGLDEFM